MYLPFLLGFILAYAPTPSPNIPDPRLFGMVMAQIEDEPVCSSTTTSDYSSCGESTTSVIGEDTTEIMNSNMVYADDPDALILIDHVYYTPKAYEDEYISTYTIDPLTKNITEKKSRQEQLTEKRHHRRPHLTDHRHLTQRVQWLRCDLCGKLLRGYQEAYYHFEERGHKKFDKVDLD